MKSVQTLQHNIPTDPKTYAATPMEVDPQLVSEAIAYFQTASRAFKAGALRAPFYQKQ